CVAVFVPESIAGQEHGSFDGPEKVIFEAVSKLDVKFGSVEASGAAAVEVDGVVFDVVGDVVDTGDDGIDHAAGFGGPGHHDAQARVQAVVGRAKPVDFHLRENNQGVGQAAF